MRENKRSVCIAMIVLTVATNIIMLVNCQTEPANPPQEPTLLHVQEFETVIEKMLPTETFSFDINENEIETIKIWPPSDTDEVIITYYINNEENPHLVTGHGFFAECYLNSNVFRTFLNQKVGVCKIKITTRPSMIDLKFKSESETVLSVYLNYEFKKLEIESRSTFLEKEKNSNVPTLAEESKQKLSMVSETFEKVRLNSESQEGMLRTVLRGMSKHGKRLEGNIKYAHHRIVTETVIVILSGLLGMWILRKELNKGYELLV